METIYATASKPSPLELELLEYISSKSDELCLTDAILYYGFPIFRDYDDNQITSSLTVVSPKHGIILFKVSSHEAAIQEEDDSLTSIYSHLEGALRKSRSLRQGKRHLAINLDTAIYSCLNDNQIDADKYENEILLNLSEIKNFFDSKRINEFYSETIINETRSIIEGSKALNKPSKRDLSTLSPDSKAKILADLENEVNNFDIEQRIIAISLINGPQRIRGLAGSGKTIVLAMKVAHIHLTNPDKKILFSFFTKSLYDLIRDTIDRFYRHFAGSEPDWNKIDILHAWGGRSLSGVYYNACIENGIDSLSFPAAKSRNPSEPFGYACSKTLEFPKKQKYDYILIDEAQDLPNEFFQLCYQIAKGEKGEEKNIIWAYDDFQSIFKVYQRTAEELFGSEGSKPRISLTEFETKLENHQRNDLVLHKCYRNPLEVLVVAHALGLGLYTEQPVQSLENEEHWNDVGYELIEGDYVVGQKVTFERSKVNSPLSLSGNQAKDELIICHLEDNLIDECNWIVTQIYNATRDGLLPHEIMVICLDDRNAKSYFSRISKKLIDIDIRSNNLLASTASAPHFRLKNMVTLTTVHRAKGNEASMVFACGIDALEGRSNLRSIRNQIFTAFTRTKAWLRVSSASITRGTNFKNEIDTALNNSPRLTFITPDINEIEIVQRDLESSLSEKDREVRKHLKALQDQGLSQDEIIDQFSLLGSQESGSE